jgi:hypothetical protein
LVTFLSQPPEDTPKMNVKLELKKNEKKTSVSWSCSAACCWWFLVGKVGMEHGSLYRIERGC